MAGINLSLKLKRAIRAIKHFVSSQSYLSVYLMVMAEGLLQKVRRVFLDPSDTVSGNLASNYQHQLTLLGSSSNARHSVSDEQLPVRLKCLNPCSLYLIPWYLVVVVVNFYVFVQMTIMIGIGPQAWESELASNTLMGIDGVLIAVLVADIVAKFLIGFLRNGVIVTNKQRVVSHYMHFLFFTDTALVAVLVVALVTRGYDWNYFKVVVLFKLARVLEIDAIVMRVLATRAMLRVLFVMAKQVINILVFAHTIGVFFYMLDSYLMTTSVCAGDNGAFCWLNSATAYSPISSLPWQVQYFYSFYWGVNTISNVNYGDIAPQNPYETIYMFLVFVLSLIVCGYIINQIVMVLFHSVVAKEDYRAQLSTYTTFMEEVGIGRQYEPEVKTYLYEQYKARENHFDASRLLGKLTEELRRDYYLDAYRYVHQGLVYFLGDGEATWRLVFGVQQRRYGAGEKVSRQGVLPAGLSYLHRGRLKFSCLFREKEYQLATVDGEGSFFFSFQFFTQTRTRFRVMADANSVVYFIPGSVFEQQRTESVQFKEMSCLLRYELQCMAFLGRVFYSCFYCGANHQWFECGQYFVVMRGECSGRVLVEERGNRIVSKRHYAWRDRKALLDLNRMINRYQDDILVKIEQRLARLVYLREREVGPWEVDCVHEWPAYLPHCNITAVQARFNNRVGGHS